MNKKNAKLITLKEAYRLLPKWWLTSLEINLSIIKHSKYPSFRHVAAFFESSLSHIIDEDSSIKYISIKCIDKGEHDNKFYITLQIYFKLKDKADTLKIEKSLHVKKRIKINYD